MYKFYFFIIITFFLEINVIVAQEFDMTVSVNTGRVNSVDIEAINDLQKKISDFVNSKSWSNAKFETFEKIKCSTTINLTSFDGGNGYVSEINFKVSRPVYNSSYTTTTFNMRDKDFNFSFFPSQILNYSEISSNDNLVATIVFYLYIMLGIDADSFALNGGKIYFDKALKIANEQQMSTSKGWETYTGTSRTNLVYDLTNSKLSSFHQLWYNYHRGLDEMSINTNRGKIKVLATIDILEELSKAKSNTILLSIFADSKLQEILNIAAIEDTQEKNMINERLSKVYPGKKTLINQTLSK